MTDEQRYADDARRYVLESRIATGGMGEVWRARDTVLGRPVAVKVLKAEFADDSLFRTRFETEARHAGSLHHPGIASVFDYGEASAADGSTAPRPFLVMELVDGQPLSALLRPGSPMEPDVARDLLAQAAVALGVAHAAGIVHRDVKPGNLLVTPDRRVKITDFGIARAAEGIALTQTGQVMGTPQYLSPEQAEGRGASPASDVYSLGVVAFECLAGRRPFVADSPVATALAHVRQPVPDLPPDVPADLAAVVRRSMSKDPAERYADGAAFAAALSDPSGAAAGAAAATVVAPAAATAGPSGPVTSVMPATAATPAAPTDRRTSRSGPPWWIWPLLLLLLLVGALLLAQVLGGEDSPDRSARTGTPSSSAPSEPTSTEPTTTDPTTSEPTTEEPTTEEPATVTIDEDDYIGRDHKEVEQELKDLGLKPKGEEIENDGTQEEGAVASVDPDGALEEGSEVTVSYYGAPPDEPLGQIGPGNSSGNGKSNGNSGGGNG